WGYYAWCGSTVPDINYHGPVRLSRLGVDCPDLPYACSDDPYVVTHQSPKDGWVKMQWEGGYDPTHDNPTVRFTTYPDGAVTDTDHYGNTITTFETIYGCGYPPSDGLQGLGISGFSRVPRTHNGTNSFRYFTAVYVDGTPARVMLGDHAVYESCTVMEPQSPTSWGEGAIEVTANLGGLPASGTAYLYVFDGDGQHSSPGFPVELGVELPAACDDGQDNDADGLVDYPEDPGCSSPDDDDESDCPGCGGAGQGGGGSTSSGTSASATAAGDDGCGCRLGQRRSGRSVMPWLLLGLLVATRRRLGAAEPVPRRPVR
ncbi:MAG: hypothetical protein JRI68_33010, partial [Deltaproteobacteria bacterium]|nr:hypothetical protein [Deltaproteobacteria bacterium]